MIKMPDKTNLREKSRNPNHRLTGPYQIVLLGILLSTSIFLQQNGICQETISGKLNLNTATLTELSLLPFIGETKAAAIIKFRESQGNYASVDQLLEKQVLGPQTYGAINPYLTVTGSSNIKISTATEKDSKQNSIVKIRHRITTKPGEIRILPDEEYYPNLLDAIAGAKYEITMAMFLFKITDSPKNQPTAVLKELIKARQRGVKIRILLEESGYDDGINEENHRTARKLSRNGIKVSFDSPKTTTHTKLVVIDGRYVFVGSHNLTHSALDRNHEFSLLVDNRALAQETLFYIRKLRME